MISLEAAEERLRSALEVDPSGDALSWLDARLEEAIAGHQAGRRAFDTWRWLARPLPLIAASLLLAGAVAAAVTLIERVATSSGPGWETAWELAEVINQVQSDAGYTITLDRAYADVNQVVTFVSVSADDPSLPEPGEGGTVYLEGGVVDAAGRALDRPVGTGAVEAALSASIDSWEYPSVEAGTYVLDISSIQVIPGDIDQDTLAAPTAGSWRFEFEMPEPAGVILEPHVTATDHGLTVELEELRMAPSMIVGRMYLTVDGQATPVWVPTIAEVKHNGETVSTDSNANMFGIPLREAGATGFEFRTGFGVAESAGTWEIRISQIEFPEEAGPDLMPATEGPWAMRSGSWVLELTVP